VLLKSIRSFRLNLRRYFRYGWLSGHSPKVYPCQTIAATNFPAIDLSRFTVDPIFSVYDAGRNGGGVAETDSCALVMADTEAAAYNSVQVFARGVRGQGMARGLRTNPWDLIRFIPA